MSATLHSPRQKALRDFLVEKRKAAGLTQVQLARRLGVYQSWIVRLESGERRVDVIEVLALADAIGFDPHELLDRLRIVKR